MALMRGKLLAGALFAGLLFGAPDTQAIQATGGYPHKEREYLKTQHDIKAERIHLGIIEDDEKIQEPRKYSVVLAEKQKIEEEFQFVVEHISDNEGIQFDWYLHQKLLEIELSKLNYELMMMEERDMAFVMAIIALIDN